MTITRLTITRLSIVLAMLALLLTSWTQWAHSASAMPYAQTRITITATGGYGSDGAYLLGEWFPVHVTLNNPGGGDLRRVHVEVDSLGDDPRSPLATYSRDIDLPAQARKEVTLYAYSTTFNRNLDVRLLEGSAVLEKITLNLSPFEQQSNILVGVLSSDPSLLNFLNSEALGHTEYPPQASPYGAPSASTVGASQATVVHLGIADLPTLSHALDSLGVIIVDDVDTGSLTPAQKAAISAWVGRGGMLVGLGRPGGAGALSGLADLLPVTLGNPQPVTSLSGLGNLVATPITPTGQVLVPSATLRTGQDIVVRALASQDGTLLVAMRDLGRGKTAYIGLSPAIAPLKGWDGTVPLFRRILAEHTVRVSSGAERRVGASANVFSFYGGIFDIPGLDLPSEGLLALFLLVYIIIIGPINFIVLRRMRRGELAWLTIPALVLLFSVGAYILGYGAKGADLLAVRSKIVYTAPGVPQASVQQFFGIFSPQRGTYSMELEGDATVSELDPSGYGARPDTAASVAGGGDTGITRLNNVNVNTLSLRGYMSESALTAESPLDSSLYMGADLIEGTIRNRSNTALQDVALVRGDQTQIIGNLAPGQEAKVQMGVSAQPFTSNSPEVILPTPDGVNASGSPYYGSRNKSDAQCTYTRQIQLLDSGLGALIAGTAPTGLGVVALSWGPDAPGAFSVSGHNPRTSDLNLWTSSLPVRGDGPTHPTLKPGNAPFLTYAPGNHVPWLTPDSTDNSAVTLNPYADLLV